MSAWTPVPKPTETSVMSFTNDAQPWGLLLAITSVVTGGSASVTSGWTDIQKPTSSVWVQVAKPTT